MLKRLSLTFMILTLFSTMAFPAAWQLDKAHSSVSFSVRHMVISKTTGKFSDFDGTFTFDDKNWTASSAEMTVKAASVNTEEAKRDEHLRQADFFDADKYPDMKFKSKKVIKGEGNEFKLIGDLTIKDVTKEVAFEGEFNGIVNDPWGNTRAGFTVETKIDRQDFNLSFSKTLDTGGLVVGNEVEVVLELELIKAN